MTTSIKLKKSSVTGRVPSTVDLDYGELAINYTDGILYFKNSTNVVKSISSNAIGVDSAATINLIDSDYIQLRRPAEAIFNVASSGASAYTFSGDGFSSNRNNPTLYLTRGKTYKFVVSASGHPFQIRVSNNGSAYNTGVTNNGIQTGNILFTPDMNAPTSLVYQCTIHSGMVGNIVILDDTDAAGLDSALASQLINSSYIQARQIKYTNNDFADSAFVTSQINLIDSAYVQARQINNPTGVDSSATSNFIDSAYIQSRQTSNPAGVDSAATINLINSSYVQSRQIQYTNNDFADSAFVTTQINSIDAAYIQARQIKYTNNDFADSAFVTTQINLIDSSYIQNRQIQYTNNDFADSAFVTTQINNLIDAAPGALDTLNELAAAIGDDVNFSTTITNQIAAKLDSAQAIAIIDSSYVQARQINNPSGVDSAATIALVDSAYIQARQTSGGGGSVDSAATISLIGTTVDSAYVQARFGTLRESNNSLIISGSIIPETDSAFSLGTAQRKFKDLHLSGGTVFLDNLALSADPATQTISVGRLDSNNIVNVLGVIATVDSAGVSAIVDSAFLESRLGDFVSETELTSKNFTTFDSADATSVIDSSYIDGLNANAGKLNGQNGAFYSDFRNLTNRPEAGIDYGTVVASATSAINILDILISQTTIDYGTVGSPGGLKSNYGTL